MSRVTTAYETENSTNTTTEEGGADQQAGAETAKVLDDAAIANLSEAEKIMYGSTETEKDSEVMLRIQSGVRMAQRKVQAQSTFVIDNASDEGQLEKDLKNSLAAQARGNPEMQAWVVIVLDVKLCCESGSQGRYRMGPTRPAQLRRLLNAMLASRPDGDLDDGDVLVVLDGGKGGGNVTSWVESTVCKLLPSKRYQQVHQTIFYTHDSIEQRMERASKCPLQLTEMASFITLNTPVSFKIQNRLNFAGNTRGNVLGPFAKPEWSDSAKVWQVTAASKKDIFGSDNLPLPGGRLPVELDQGDDDDQEDGAAKKKARIRPNDLVPCFYHECAAPVSAELAHSLRPISIIDLTPGSGHWAYYCIKNRVSYTGIVFTEHHKQALMDKLASRVLCGMVDSNDTKLYDPAFAKDVQQQSGEKSTEDKNSGGGRCGRGKGSRGGKGGHGRGGNESTPSAPSAGSGETETGIGGSPEQDPGRHEKSRLEFSESA
eukprot:s2757_g10.t1